MKSTFAKQEEPFNLFNDWLSKAKASRDIKEPVAMSLATVSKEGKPSVRMVLLREIDEEGFGFFTNLGSKKSQDLLHNPNAALCFYWPELGRQIRIEGRVSLIDDKRADAYFLSRDRSSRIGAWASRQSEIMSDEQDLPRRINLITERFAGQEVPRPSFWSGFKLKPEAIEFWQEGEFRLHKRILYKKVLKQENGQEGWEVLRLYP